MQTLQPKRRSTTRQKKPRKGRRRKSLKSSSNQSSDETSDASSQTPSSRSSAHGSAASGADSEAEGEEGDADGDAGLEAVGADTEGDASDFTMQECCDVVGNSLAWGFSSKVKGKQKEQICVGVIDEIFYDANNNATSATGFYIVPAVNKKFVGKWVPCSPSFPFTLVGTLDTLGDQREDVVSVKHILAIIDQWEYDGVRTLDGMWADGCTMNEKEWFVCNSIL
jgi:hypothetical protein